MKYNESVFCFSSLGGETFYNIDLNDPDDLATFKYADDSNQVSSSFTCNACSLNF